jgi:hypothetical protein
MNFCCGLATAKIQLDGWIGAKLCPRRPSEPATDEEKPKNVNF